MLRSSLVSISAVLTATAALAVMPDASVAASGPPAGKYACYAYVGYTTYYNGTTVILKSGHHYTTKGAHLIGRYAVKGKKVIFRSGKLKGFKSLWRVDGSGTPALIVEFPNHSSTNTATCGLLK
jgi:hypothetical protein